MDRQCKKTTNNLPMDRQCKKNNKQFTYGQTVQKNNKQFTYGQTVQKNNKQFTYGQTVQKKQQQFTYGQTVQKTTAIYIWTVHIYRLYRRQCAKKFILTKQYFISLNPTLTINLPLKTPFTIKTFSPSWGPQASPHNVKISGFTWGYIYIHNTIIIILNCRTWSPQPRQSLNCTL